MSHTGHNGAAESTAPEDVHGIWLSRVEKWRVPSVLFYAVLVYAALLVFPAYYLPTLQGLDPSWGFGLNYFAHSSLKFGPDLIFTHGPLGYVAVPMDIGSNIAVAIVIRIAVWALLLWQLVSIWRSDNRLGAVVLVLSLIMSNKLYVYYWDYLLSATILILCVRLLDKRFDRIILVVIAALTGISFLVKFTVFALAAVLISVCLAEALLSEKSLSRRRAALLLLVVMSGPCAYLIYNPSIGGLVLYIRGALAITSGYVAWMSLPTEPGLAVRGGIICALIVVGVSIAVWRKALRVAPATLVLLATWVVFRHGFVRSGVPHSAVFFCFAIFIFGVLFSQLRAGRWLIVYGALFLGLSIVALNGVSARWPVWNSFWWTAKMNLDQAIDLVHWTRTEQEFAGIREQFYKPTAITQYTADIRGAGVLVFPWDLAYAAHRDFTLIPIYALQAYSAYTNYLDRISAEKILSPTRPIDFVVMEWKSIDGRHPLLDDPAVWNALFTDYVPRVVHRDSALLAPRQVPLHLSYAPLARVHFRPDAWVSVPRRSTPVGVSIRLRPTVVGSLITALYKLPIVLIQVRTASGVTQTYRVPAEVLSTAVPINSMPLSFESLVNLWTKNSCTDPIVELRLTGDGLQHMRDAEWSFYEVRGAGVSVTYPGP